MEEPVVFSYVDYRSFLRDWYDAKKAANPRFSHRAFVRRTGQKSPSLLADVIQGRRNLTSTTAKAFCRAMGLEGAESRFFQLLAALERAETNKQKSEIWHRIAASKHFRDARRLETEAFEYLSHWYYPAIKELANRPDFKPDAAWVCQHIRPELTLEEAQSALKVLFSLGMLTQSSDGTVSVVDANIVTTPEITWLALQNYYQGMLTRARDALVEFKAAERHYSTITVAIPRSMVPKLKEELTQMTNRLVTLCEEDPSDRDQVIQINLNFHPLSSSRDVPSE